MSNDDLAVRRAALTLAVKKGLEDNGFTFDITRSELMTVLKVGHAQTPDWSGEAVVAVQHNLKPALRLLFNGTFVGSSPKVVATFIEMAKSDWSTHKQLAKSVAESEAEAQKWSIRQMRELGELEELECVSYEIIRQGPFAGRYRMRLEPGHPFEFMTIGQLREFHKLCVRCKDNRK